MRLSPSLPDPAPAPTCVDERITNALRDAEDTLTIKQLRTQCRVRNSTLYERLAALTTAGHIRRSGEGYRLAAQD